MSAYLVEDQHVIQLAAYLCNANYNEVKRLAVYHGFGFQMRGRMIESDHLATHYANILMAENYRSLAVRYGDDDPPHIVKVNLGEITRSDRIPAVNILHSVACFDYQACESENWESTDAYKLCQMIKDKAIRALPGYSDAPWGAPYDFGVPAPTVTSLSSMMQ